MGPPVIAAWGLETQAASGGWLSIVRESTYPGETWKGQGAFPLALRRVRFTAGFVSLRGSFHCGVRFTAGFDSLRGSIHCGVRFTAGHALTMD
jgi:hypothetical protein